MRIASGKTNSFTFSVRRYRHYNTTIIHLGLFYVLVAFPNATDR